MIVFSNCSNYFCDVRWLGLFRAYKHIVMAGGLRVIWLFGPTASIFSHPDRCSLETRVVKGLSLSLYMVQVTLQWPIAK